MDLKWIFVLFLISAVCGVSAYVPHRYHIVNENKTWTEAQSYCRQNYTDLATINNMDEMKKLNATLNEKASGFVWIGLDRGNTRKWLWSLADESFYREGDTYRNWNSGEPNNAGRNQYCVAMKNDTGTWTDESCDKRYTFVCYDRKKMNSDRYILINETKSWRDAQSYCREHYTDLASVRNQTENQQIHNLAKYSISICVWIGLFNDSWKWSDQSTSSFRYWRSDQPDNVVGIKECAAVSMTDQGEWHDLDCETKNPFICHENKLILINQNLTWREALRYCRVNHVDLVSVHSEEIQLWVKEVAQKASTEHVWLGLRHTCTLSFWFWVDGESICYQNWAPGNGTEGENCSSVERTGAVQSRGGQQWVSLPEDQELNFICTTYED
ncbi:macrophage mannose receptor 1-like [Colossoma macropomum]|uniref:macrophage mannose receptor 1-like n=1 Tax=Colossoma macropomum TaxID=42526 RepID=UPI001864C2E4|nr:macrophage mannose receptor 1-like [Colossoma macropomum]